jgi:membrane fusion protein (multidrug efflux system)
VFVLTTVEGKLRAQQRVVEAGAVIGDDIAIENGLAVGDLIAAAGSFKLRDGALVTTEAAALGAGAPQPGSN